MMDIAKNIIVQTTPDTRIVDLKGFLFNSLIIEMTDQSRYLNNLLELFLVDIYSNNSMNVFVQTLIDEATFHLDGIIIENKRMEWFFKMNVNKQKNHLNTTRERFFKN